MHIPLFSSKSRNSKQVPSINTKIDDFSYKRPTKPHSVSVSASSGSSNSHTNLSDKSKASNTSSNSNEIFNNSDESLADDGRTQMIGNTQPQNLTPFVVPPMTTSQSNGGSSGGRSRSNSYRYPQPPSVNTNLAVKNRSRSASTNYDDPPGSPSSLSTRRQISDKVKNTPSSYVRHSRVYSNDFDVPSIYSDTNSINNVQPSKNANSFSSFLSATKTIPPELAPVVTLLNCHNFRNYYNGTLFMFDEQLNGWLEVSAKLTGNELSIWEVDADDFKPKYYNLFDSNITLDSKNLIIKFSDDLSESHYTLMVRTTDVSEYKNWLAALYLSCYEKLSLNESFTAVILSLIGPRLSDIHTLLSKKKYVKYDWCNIRLPQVNHKWVKCYLAIYPSTSKMLGKIEIYSSEKVSKKNLICYISKVTNVYNLFPENVNMIEFNSLMKLNGNVYVNSKFEHLFTPTTYTGATHAKGDSISNLPQPSQFNKSHERAASQSSFFSQSSSPPSSPKVKSSHNFIKTNYIYLMPQSHPGVQEIETMIRNYVPVIDAFKLYGRPKQLNSDKYDKTSLLFGLPSLPHYEYLSFEDAKEVVELHLQDSVADKWTLATWFNEFRSLIEYKMANENYKGNGSVAWLYKSLELDDSDLVSITSAPDISFPQYSGELSPSPVGSPVKRVASPLPKPVTGTGFSPASVLQSGGNSPSLAASPFLNQQQTPQQTSSQGSPLPDPQMSGSPGQSPIPAHSFRPRPDSYNNIDGLTHSMHKLGNYDELDEPINLSIKQHT